MALSQRLGGQGAVRCGAVLCGGGPLTDVHEDDDEADDHAPRARDAVVKEEVEREVERGQEHVDRRLVQPVGGDVVVGLEDDLRSLRDAPCVCA